MSDRRMDFKCFSTLYRVDAIEGIEYPWYALGLKPFQYPLSGRCY